MTHENTICLYGAANNSGWLAQKAGTKTPIGDHTPFMNRTYTESIQQGCGALLAAGAAGIAVVYDAGGERMARGLLRHCPSYERLKWCSATVYSIPAADVIRAATMVARPAVTTAEVHYVLGSIAAARIQKGDDAAAREHVATEMARMFHTSVAWARSIVDEILNSGAV